MGNVSPPKDELDLLDLAFVLRKSRLVLIAATAAFFGVGVLFVIYRVPFTAANFLFIRSAKVS